MKNSLFFQAIGKFLLGVVLVGALLFLPAGTFRYPAAWLFLGVLFIPMFLAGLVMMAKSPALLASRLKAKEQQAEQSMVVKLSGLMFFVGFVLCGLTFRFGWTILPCWVTILGVVLFLAAYALYAEVLRENAFLSRTIEVQENQTVVDTGLYGIVRHPMYSVTIVLFLSMPLILGSLQAFVLFLVYPLILIKRIRNEEALLKEALPGYAEYCEKIRYRLLPGVW